MITNAHPKTGAYPFTTIFPTVGVLEPEQFERITVADIPGLIEGAVKIGLGHRFLKHVERCKVLIFMIDMEGAMGVIHSATTACRAAEALHASLVRSPN